MNPQTLKRLAAALALLVAVWLVVGLARRSQRDTEGHLPVSRIDPRSVDAIVLAKGADTLRFTRQGGTWTVNGHAANVPLVDAMLNALADSSARSELIAESAGSHAGLGLDSLNARRLSVRTGTAARPVAELLLGHRGESYGTVYARLPGQASAYQVKSGLAEVVDRQLDDWRDKSIARIGTDSVERIDVTRGKKSYSLTRNDKSWSVDGKDADSAAVAGLLNQFKELNATGFATASEASTLDFSKPVRAIRVLDKQGKTLLALSADSMASGFWVRRDGDSTTFRLDSWALNQLTPVDSALRKK